MITSLKQGYYKLIETKRHTKVLYLDNRAYAWVELGNLAEILVVTRKTHKTDCVLSRGHYLLYEVHDEPNLSDHIHLELEVGQGQWQGYLLLSGTPDEAKPRGRIIPTAEVITTNPRYDLLVLDPRRQVSQPG